ncbi:hypothetical protein EIN_056460 [Entamoeba invadens IP1]|uniref:hypothetical protein n=1 Tax=Entamoeba invadens IP1 TaxID=370355 RepID=UPI0002C3DFBF|nr:hypothetical protein EIN_056460 [Entamoeba invadens IP1]ELP93271.1 hypothetical protein EIN_056460 [Entamoeba invadens IP1]|eukprot:XP_004260042.1 hypothetical protein EIN_056460 [Entamoeba invadens IP1]
MVTITTIMNNGIINIYGTSGHSVTSMIDNCLDTTPRCYSSDYSKELKLSKSDNLKKKGQLSHIEQYSNIPHDYLTQTKQPKEDQLLSRSKSSNELELCVQPKIPFNIRKVESSLKKVDKKPSTTVVAIKSKTQHGRSESCRGISDNSADFKAFEQMFQSKQTTQYLQEKEVEVEMIRNNRSKFKTRSEYNFKEIPQNKQYPFSEYEFTLKGWCKSQQYNVLYDSNLDGLSRKLINARTCAKAKTMFIVCSKSSVFGCFNGAQLPIETNSISFVKEDDDFFAFSLKNPHNTQPLKFAHKTNTLTFCINAYGEDDSWLIYCYHCFYIRTNGLSKIDNTFSSFFVDQSGFGSSIFNNTVSPNTFTIDRIIVLQWF